MVKPLIGKRFHQEVEDFGVESPHGELIVCGDENDRPRERAVTSARTNA